MTNKKCLIFGAGSWYSYVPIPEKDTFVIAVDAGYKKIKQFNIEMNLLVGDFDSMEKPVFLNASDQEKVIELEKEKDDTDTLYALKMGLKEKCAEFHIFGGTGGRIEHTLANIQCLAFLANEGTRGFLYGKDYIMTCIKGKEGIIEFDKEKKGFVSVFSLSDVCQGVYEEGLKYELNNAEVKNTFPIGISNEFIGEKSSISVKEGSLLIVYPNNKRRIRV